MDHTSQSTSSAESSPPVALTIAGSDNSAGAGAQADVKTFSALGVYGLTAITCVVAEVPGRVSAIQPVEPRIVAEQIELSFGAFPVAAVKTGMLYSREIIETVCDALEKISPRVPLVVDPVMIATSGDPLLRVDAVAVYKERLFKHATLVTPNLDEAAALLGRPIRTLPEMREAAHELAEKFGVAWLLKGGHLGGDQATDLLICDGALAEFSAPFVRGVSTHGTGCTYAAAITAALARGLPLEQAVKQAKTFVTRAIASHFRWNDGATHALNHFTQPPV
jgi:hydroxymethylpyrimidine/phosphomethylpyrimidine kinase